MEPLPVHDDAPTDGPLGHEAGRGEDGAPHLGECGRGGLRVGRRRSERAIDHLEQRLELEGLLEEVEGPEPDHAHRGLDRPVAGDHDDGDARRLLPHAGDELDAIHLGHPDVDDGEARRRALQQVERLPPISGLDDLEPLVRQHPAQRVADLLLVVDHQDRVGHR